MQPRLRARELVGWLCALLSLLLLSPGVTIVRAGDYSTAATADGPSCSDAPSAHEAVVQGFSDPRSIQALAQRYLGEAPQDEDVPIPLNTRGYNYGAVHRPQAPPPQQPPASR